MSESEAESENTDTGATINDVIDQVEDCIRRLEAAEQAAYLQLKAPTEAERTALWTKHSIIEKFPVEQLEGLLQRLATEERLQPWFQWLTWVFFGPDA